MRVGYQGEPGSYSYRASDELLPGAERVGFASFVAAFAAMAGGEVERLVLPIENSTTGSVLPVLDRLVEAPASIVAEHLVEVRHALLGLPGAGLEDVQTVRSHPVALGQAEDLLLERGWTAIPTHDTAGAVREVAEMNDPSQAALAPPGSGEEHGLEILLSEVIDRHHNTTRFVVLAPGEPSIDATDDKTSIAFETSHTAGALALALTELGLRGANLTRIESRPAAERWNYRFFVDLVHPVGEAGLGQVLEPPPATMTNLHVLGSYQAAE
ncbi:MAG: prephenate dehydratase [Acidimicrobiia bacterium]|nr:prephenate dehydratase [Acidimicrobiia bacterium]